ncbi:ABC transporter substrate-binding protein [Chloroflexota bacterium]
MRKGILWVVLSWLIVAVFVLASCGPAAPGEQEEEEEEPAAGEVQYGGTLTVINTSSHVPPTDWDPIAMYEMGLGFYSPIYESLLIGDYLNKGPRGTNESTFTDLNKVPETALTGLLAESWEMPDPLTIIYHIREGVYFPDKPGVMESREFTAEDVVFAFDRLVEESGITGQQFDSFVLGEKVATDRYTLTFTMPAFDPKAITWTGWMYFPSLVGYPQELVEAGFEWQNITGTGPFMLEDVVEDSYITYKRNPDYWGEIVLDGKEYQLPFVDSFDQLLITDPMTSLAALRAGQVDLMEPVSRQHLESLEETNPDLVKFRALDSRNCHIFMRQSIPPFDDVRVRQAALLAVDNEAIGDALYGEYELLNWPSEIDSPIYTPLDELPEETRELFEYHPDKARDLLAEAGYEDGVTVDVLVPPNQAFFSSDDLIDFLHYYWGEVGITLEINKQEEAVFWDMVGERQYTTMMEIWGAGPPQVQMEDFCTVGFIWNMSDVVDDQLVEWREESKITVDQDERLAILKKMQARYWGQADFLPFPTPYSYSYCWPWVKNWFGETNVTFLSPQPVYKTIWIDQVLKAEMGY